MPLKALATSFIVHLGVATSIALGAGGHTSDGSTAPALIEITLLPSPVTETPDTRSDDEPKAAVRGAPQRHTHPYPVPPSHDSQAHDANVRHDEKPAHATPAAVAEPSGTDVSAAPKEAMPTFAISATVANAASGAVVGSGANANAGQLAEETLGASSVDVPAKLLTSVTAAYPPAARSDDREGDVGLEVVVDREGRVVDARVVRSAGIDFDRAALSAIRGYRFAPARHQGRMVRVRMPWTVQFRLR